MTDAPTCPECGSSWVHQRTRTLAIHETGIPGQHCQSCGAAFDAPEQATPAAEVSADD